MTSCIWGKIVFLLHKMKTYHHEFWFFLDDEGHFSPPILLQNAQKCWSYFYIGWKQLIVALKPCAVTQLICGWNTRYLWQSDVHGKHTLNSGSINITIQLDTYYLILMHDFHNNQVFAWDLGLALSSFDQVIASFGGWGERPTIILSLRSRLIPLNCELCQ